METFEQCVCDILYAKVRVWKLVFLQFSLVFGVLLCWERVRIKQMQIWISNTQIVVTLIWIYLAISSFSFWVNQFFGTKLTAFLLPELLQGSLCRSQTHSRKTVWVTEKAFFTYLPSTTQNVDLRAAFRPHMLNKLWDRQQYICVDLRNESSPLLCVASLDIKRLIFPPVHIDSSCKWHGKAVCLAFVYNSPTEDRVTPAHNAMRRLTSKDKGNRWCDVGVWARGEGGWGCVGWQGPPPDLLIWLNGRR